MNMQSEGSVLAVGTQNGRVRLVDPATGEISFDIQAHVQAICCLALSPEGDILATSSFDKSWRLWNVDGTERLRVQGHNGKGACACQPHRLLSWRSVEPACQVVGHARRVDAIAFTPGGDQVATGSQDESVVVWNAVTGQQSLRMLGHDHAISAVAFSKDGTMLVSGCVGGIVRLWDSSSGSLLRVVAPPPAIDRASVRSLQFSAHHFTALWGNCGGNLSSGVVDILTGETIFEPRASAYNFGSPPVGPSVGAFSPDGASTAKVRRFGDENSAPQYRIAMNTRRGTVSGYGTGPSAAWEIPDPALRGPGAGVVLPPVVTGRVCGRLHAIGEKPCADVAHCDRVTTLAFSLDSKAVASGSADTTCKVTLLFFQP